MIRNFSAIYTLCLSEETAVAERAFLVLNWRAEVVAAVAAGGRTDVHVCEHALLEHGLPAVLRRAGRHRRRLLREPAPLRHASRGLGPLHARALSAGLGIETSPCRAREP